MTPRIVGVRVVRGHSKGCSMVGSALWQPSDGSDVTRDAIGRKGRYLLWKWARFLCNQSGCPAEVLIRQDILGDFAHRMMRAAVAMKKGATDAE